MTTAIYLFITKKSNNKFHIYRKYYRTEFKIYILKNQLKTVINYQMVQKNTDKSK